MEKLTGILLAGGKSLRMGTDKALKELFEYPMIIYPLRMLRNFCTEILISANDERFNFLGHEVVADHIKNIGPIAGLYSCLEESSNFNNIAVACDMPFINGTLLRKMTRTSNDFDAIVPVLNNKPEPLYALYRKSILPKISENIQCRVYAIRELLQKANVCYMEVEKHETIEFFNINTLSEVSAVVSHYQLKDGQLEEKNISEPFNGGRYRA